MPTCEITTIDLLENAFPLCFNALLNRYGTTTGGRQPSSTDRTKPLWLRIVIRAIGSCLDEISISCVTDCCAVMSSTMISTTKIIISFKPYYYFIHTKTNSIINSIDVTMLFFFFFYPICLQGELVDSRGK